jgi:hypothetical protein
VTNRGVRTGRLAMSLTVHRAALPPFNVEQPWRCNRSRLATP